MNLLDLDAAVGEAGGGAGDGDDVTGEVEELVRQPVSLMPADLAAALTADELVDLVAWLESQRAAN